MKIIKCEEVNTGTNSEKCRVTEYPFGDSDIDLALATIVGRYPDFGFCVNLVSKELIYVIEGSGRLCFEDKTVHFKQGDAVLIENNRKYYWDTDYCRVSITCSPAWSPEQYKLV